VRGVEHARALAGLSGSGLARQLAIADRAEAVSSLGSIAQQIPLGLPIAYLVMRAAKFGVPIPVASSQVYFTLHDDNGWPYERAEHWLACQAVAALFSPPGQPRHS
jgi:hypothetical protein